MMTDVPPAELAALARHRGIIDTLLTLTRDGLLIDVGQPATVLAEALDAVGIRPPHRYADQLRRRFPSLYREAEDSTPEDDVDLVRQLAGAALHDYAVDLLDLDERLCRITNDPDGVIDDLERPSGILTTIGNAAALELHREDYLDQLDTLIGESYPTTHRG